MASRARSWINVPLTVTLNTDPPGISRCQEETVRGAMGTMANAAPFRLHSQMRENPGPPLIRMAIETDVNIKLIPFP